jgi:hypothetical protein
MVITVPTTLVCRQSQTAMDGVGSSDLWKNCEPSNAGTLTTGGTVISTRTKCLLLRLAGKDVLKFCLNYSRLFRHWSLGAEAMDCQEIEPTNRGENRRRRRLNCEGEVTVSSKDGFMPGQTLDISESGLSATLPVETSSGRDCRTEDQTSDDTCNQ